MKTQNREGNTHINTDPVLHERAAVVSLWIINSFQPANFVYSPRTVWKFCLAYFFFINSLILLVYIQTTRIERPRERDRYLHTIKCIEASMRDYTTNSAKTVEQTCLLTDLKLYCFNPTWNSKLFAFQHQLITDSMVNLNCNGFLITWNLVSVSKCSIKVVFSMAKI